jgi:hypothetical protein
LSAGTLTENCTALQQVEKSHTFHRRSTFMALHAASQPVEKQIIVLFQRVVKKFEKLANFV